MKKIALGLTAALGLVATEPTAASERSSLALHVSELVREARRDLRVENQAALEQAPRRFLDGRLAATPLAQQRIDDPRWHAAP